MPYKSKAQAGFFHANKGNGKGQVPATVVAEFDAASKGKKLPAKAPKPHPSLLDSLKKARKK